MRALLLFICLLSINGGAEAATISAGTVIKARMAESINSRTRQAGYQFRIIIDADIGTQHKTLIKSGSKGLATIISIQSSSRFQDHASVVIRLTEITINRRQVEAQSFPIAGKGSSNKRKLVGEEEVDKYLVEGPSGIEITASIPVITKGYEIILAEGTTLYFTLKQSISL